MGRPNRILVDGGVYHIINRGHNRYKVFNSLDDYKAYKDIIRRYKEDFKFDLFHYCLMPNHIHLLLRISRGIELPRLMQAMTQAYAKHYKKQYKFIGNLFQGRYKSPYIDKDEYLLECGRYIERNPLRAHMVSDLSQYNFSSYNFYAGGKKDDIITENPLYKALSSDPSMQKRLYREYLLQERPYENIIDKEFKIS
ncbi:MAG: transposase [Candidatus Omnitrophota bacterium]